MVYITSQKSFAKGVAADRASLCLARVQARYSTQDSVLPEAEEIADSKRSAAQCIGSFSAIERTAM